MELQRGGGGALTLKITSVVFICIRVVLEGQLFSVHLAAQGCPKSFWEQTHYFISVKTTNFCTWSLGLVEIQEREKVVDTHIIEEKNTQKIINSPKKIAQAL